MLKVLIDAVVVIAVGFICWVAGSLYPAPPELLARVNAQALGDRAQADLQSVDWQTLRGAVGQSRFHDLAARATHLAVAAGNALAVEHQDTIDTSEAEGPAIPLIAPASQGSAGPALAGHPAGASVAHASFDGVLPLCPRMTITNAPANDGHGNVAHFTPVVNVNGVALAVDPTHNACLSSGFGPRGSSLHKGVDFHNPDGGPIMAAADGVIIEMKYRDDYGNMLLIDHGHGVYTRYCHLSGFARGLAVGAQVHAGDQIGLMGNTAGYAIPIHLHYELLLGDYNNPKQSFGLTPHSPFEYHAL